MLVECFDCAASNLFILPTWNIVVTRRNRADSLYQVSCPPVREELLVLARLVILILDDEVAHSVNEERGDRANRLGLLKPLVGLECIGLLGIETLLSIQQYNYEFALKYYARLFIEFYPEPEEFQGSRKR
ncbi:hypothetical protein MRB53_025966 [Persea americana]|uniref:Uncharacterized protein n=1 Tax=Persea americana TaxID=3435 RepID=A0ACC2LH93_PERAE|nr:hypothetical protein MRB53_025966 [Persea americana]